MTARPDAPAGSSSPSSAPPLLSVQTGLPSPSRVWTAGTLRYTRSGLIVLFVWLLCGDFAWATRDRSIVPMAQWYLNRLGTGSVLFGLLTVSFPAVISMVFSPIIGVKSDRHRGRWGRRIPFLLLITPVATAGIVGLSLTPQLAASLHGWFPRQSEGTLSLWSFCVFWTAFEFAVFTTQTVFNALINDVVPPALMGRFYGLFRAISLGVGMIFNYHVMGKVPGHYTAIMLAVGVFYGVAFMTVCLRIREGDYPPPAAPVPVPGHLRVASEVRLYLRECFSNPYYVLVFLLLAASALCFVPVNAFVIPYATSLGVDMETYGKFVALTFLISLCLSYFIGWLCDAFHPLRMVMAVMAGCALVGLWGMCFARRADTFLAAWVLHGVLSGCYYTSVASLGQRLFPKSRFATFASAAGVLISLTNMIAAPLMGTIIDWSGHAYRYTFAAEGMLAVAALVCGWEVNRRFTRLGGPDRYVAP